MKRLNFKMTENENLTEKSNNETIEFQYDRK
jgi:hypothetical protein